MDYLFANLLGIILIVLTLWWFLWSKPRFKQYTAGSNRIDILVKDGIYEPTQIKVPAKTALTLRFLREDPTPCAEVVLFPSINRNYFLPLHKVVEVALDPQPAGEIEFTCQMGMYRGKLIVE